MKLKKLEMYGFKSFAERIEVVFDEGITGIVGPNGSGKSNIGDAMRWVLGEQNARTLRGGRMEDIIFGGAEGKKPLSWCEVSLTMDNADGTLPVDYAEVNIVRRVFRNGDSEYFLNKKSCRLKDVVDLFRDTGIGRDGYSIIGQGQIARIIDSRPEERRTVFHESAGIMKFRVRKEEAQRRLENTKDNLQRLGDIMAEVEERLEPLRVQSENAKRYITLAAELKDLELNQFIRHYDQSVERIAQYKEQAAQSLAAGRQAAEELALCEEESHRLEAALDAVDQELAALRQRAGDAQALEQRRQGEENLIGERMANLRADTQRLEGERQTALDRAAQLRAEADELQQAMQKAVADLAQGNAQLKAWEADYARMAARLEDEEAKAEEHKQDIMERMNLLGDIRSAVTRLETMAEALAQRLERLAGEDAAHRAEMENTRAVQGDILAQTQRLEAEQAAMTKESDEFIARLDDLRRRRQEALVQAGQHREELQSAQTRLKMLQTMKRDYEGFAEAVRRLLKDAAAGKTQGWVQGVVAEVVEVPPQLVRAVETTLGPAMQNIITQNEADAKQLIEYLRRNQYGRATFLPITTIRPRHVNEQERSALAHEGCVGVASELVKCDQRYRSIVDNLLGRTVVARDMDAAIAMARACRHSLRFVTLQGDVINTGGSMTGGSTHSRYTSLLGREAEIEDITGKARELANAARIAQDTAQELDARVDEAKAAQEGLAGRIQQSALGLAGERERLERARQNTARLEEELARAEETRAQLQASLQDIQLQMQQAQGRQGDEETSQQALRDEMLRVQKQVNQRREAVLDQQEKINELRVALAGDSTNSENLHSQSQRMRREADEQEARARAMAGDIDQNQSRLAQEEQNLQNLGDAVSTMRETLVQLQAETASCEENRVGLRAKRDENAARAAGVRAVADDNKSAAGKLELQWVRLEADLENSTRRIWENYELSYAGAREFFADEYDGKAAAARIGEIRGEIRAIGSVNVGAVEEYQQLGERYEDYLRQRADMEAAQGDLVSIIDELNTRMEERFREQFAKICEYFTATFTELFGGGTAQLVLLDESDILNSGIEIKAQPPGTQLKLLSLLSGGEKALTAISLLFAMLRVNPSPFCLLDEIEAALDDSNVRRFAQYLRNFTDTTQFVVVTHRKGTMEACNVLYGVTMEDKGISRMLSVQLEDLPETAEQVV